jgi:hypothetical protein
MSITNGNSLPAQRFRSRGTLQSLIGPRDAVNGVLSGPNKPTLKGGDVSAMTDWIVPGFHRKRQKGEVFFNPMSSTHDEYVSGGGNGQAFRVISSGDVYSLEGDAFPFYLKYCGYSPFSDILNCPDLLSQSDFDRLATEVSTSVLSSRGRSDANLWESVAESNQTLDMISKPLNSFKAFHRKASLATAGLSAAQAWLQYRYGIKPLMNDIDAIIKARSKKLGKQRRATRESLTDSRQQNSSAIHTISFVMDLTIGQEITDTVTVRGMSLDEFVATTGFNYGFSSKDLTTLPWELVPFTFVADWFANLGDYIGAIVPTSGFTQLGSCLVYERTKSATWYVAACDKALTAGSDLSLDRPVTGYFRATNKGKTRTGLSSPGVLLRSDFRFDKTTRVLDALSLIGQQLGSRFAGIGRR